MEDEALSSRPESPKKKIKSNPVTDSEAEPSNSSESNSDVEGNEEHGHNSPAVNGLALAAPTRKGKKNSTIPDSSSESRPREQNDNSPPRIQEEVVSSSENSVGKVKESEDLTAVCDSASSVSNDKH